MIKYIFGCLLTLFGSANSMDLDYDSGINYTEVQETRDYLIKQENIYANPPKDANASLAKERVTATPFWKKIENERLRKKNIALELVNNLTFAPEDWPIQRYHLAATAHIGAPKDLLTKTVSTALSHEDYALCELLLEKGANPNGYDLVFPFLHYIKNVKLAELFLRFGANVHCAPTSTSCRKLLPKIASSDFYDLELIPLYRNAGLSSMKIANDGTTVLHELVTCIELGNARSEDQLATKTNYLLKGLSAEQKLVLLHQCRGDEQLTVFEEIESIKKRLEDENKSLNDSYELLRIASVRKISMLDFLKKNLLQKKEAAEKFLGNRIEYKEFTTGVVYRCRAPHPNPNPLRRGFEIYVFKENEDEAIRIDNICGGLIIDNEKS